MLTPLATGAYAGLGAVGAAGLAVGGYAYAAMWPTSQVFGRTLIAPPRPGELALTFDDGPNPAWTPRLLDTLAAHKVRSTFFLVGRFAQDEPALVRRIADAGHLIGNHSWSHPNLAFTASRQVREELSTTADILAQITGRAVRFFRPPFGGRRPYVLRVARELGLVPVTWNAITSDWREPSAERIAVRLTRKIDHNQQKGWSTNIVLHDGSHLRIGANRGPSVAAAARIIARYINSHRFVTLDEWSR
ncbi:MAG TPA: polysaccharide deacetylase family protein [Gammaproteobacteria bacterium]|nr:polysaccharide deacetylase family protein [Gammaproteobacteria bacterium]